MKRSSFAYYSHIISKKPIAAIILIVSVIVFSCTSVLYIPEASSATSKAGLAELQEGRNLYTHKCGSCHTLYLPEKHTKQEWRHWIDKMQPKAKLDTIEKEKIFLYMTKGQ